MRTYKAPVYRKEILSIKSMNAFFSFKTNTMNMAAAALTKFTMIHLNGEEFNLLIYHAPFKSHLCRCLAPPSNSASDSELLSFSRFLFFFLLLCFLCFFCFFCELPLLKSSVLLVSEAASSAPTALLPAPSPSEALRETRDKIIITVYLTFVVFIRYFYCPAQLKRWLFKGPVTGNLGLKVEINSVDRLV